MAQWGVGEGLAGGLEKRKVILSAKKIQVPLRYIGGTLAGKTWLVFYSKEFAGVPL